MHPLVNKYNLISDQITKAELSTVLLFAEKCLDLEGDFVEFGCYEGTTSLFLSRLITGTNKQLWVYDSFEGLPYKTAQDSSPAGFAFKKGELFARKKQLILNFKKANLSLPIIIKGWFKELQAKQIPNTISFAFLDGDYYDSILISLRLVAPKLHQDGFILVHDYERVTLPGAKKAVQSFLASNSNFALKQVTNNIAIICRK